MQIDFKFIAVLMLIYYQPRKSEISQAIQQSEREVINY